MKKFVLTIFVLFLNAVVISAGEIPVEVTPAFKVTTGGKTLQEGDFIDFKVVKDSGRLKKGAEVTGIVTYLDGNGFAGKAAAINIEEFRIKNTAEKLKGGIYIYGSAHNQFMEFKDNLLLPTAFIRGGEITLKPQKHIFMLYLEN